MNRRKLAILVAAFVVIACAWLTRDAQCFGCVPSPCFRNGPGCTQADCACQFRNPRDPIAGVCG